MRRLVAVAAVLTAVAWGAPASAQTHGKVRILIDAGSQMPSGAFSQNFTVQKNLEPAPIVTDLKVKSATFFDAGVRFRVAGPISIGVVGFSAKGKADGTVDARVPHPFFFNQPRTVTGDLSGLDRKETGAHIEVAYTAALSRALDLTIFAGPTYFKAEQALVNDVVYTDSYPFDTATFDSAPTTTVKASKTGFNAGADVTWKFKGGFGFAAVVRYAAATLPLAVDANNSVDVKAGGIQAGLGLRLIF